MAEAGQCVDNRCLIEIFSPFKILKYFHPSIYWNIFLWILYEVSSNIFSPQIKMIIGQCVNDRCNPLTFILKYFPPSFDITITFLWTIYIYFDITITFYGLFTNIIYIIKILRRVAHPLDEWVWCALDEVKKTYKAILIEGYVIFPHNSFNNIKQCVRQDSHLSWNVSLLFWIFLFSDEIFKYSVHSMS